MRNKIIILDTIGALLSINALFLQWFNVSINTIYPLLWFVIIIFSISNIINFLNEWFDL